MKFLSLAGIVAITFAPLVFGDNADKVRIENSTALIVNAEYFDPNSIITKVVPGNGSQNILQFAFTTIKTLPADTQNVYDIYRSDSGCCKFQRVGGFSDPLCSNQTNVNDKYLSDDLLKLKTSPVCGKPLHFENKNAGTMKFWNILTEQQLANRCFYVTNSITAGIGVLYEERLDYISTLKKNLYHRVKGAIMKFNSVSYNLAVHSAVKIKDE